jgi:nucleotide-binding universal stress UspA family protein
MHKHILIPTDGSGLSNEAIQYGTDLAKAVNAKVTGVTVSPPFHVFAAEPAMVTDTPESYKERMSAVSAKRLARVQDAAAATGVACETLKVLTHSTIPVLVCRTARAEVLRPFAAS